MNVGGVSTQLSPAALSQTQQAGQPVKIQGETGTVAKSAQSAMPDDELMSQKMASRGGKKLNISTKKETKSLEKSKETQAAQGAQQASKTSDSDFAEEIASIIRILKKPNRSEEDEEKIKKLLDETTENYEEAVEQLVVKTLENLDPATKEKYSDDIKRFESRLGQIKENGADSDKSFLSDFHGALGSLLGKGDKNVEKQREFIDTPGKLFNKLKKDYSKTNNFEALIALNVKILAHEAGQAGNDIDRLYVITTELKNTQVLGTLNEDCSEAENQLARSCGVELKDKFDQTH